MIEEVQLRNVLAFRALDLPLGPLTLLSGTNSSGKSSLLHVLALLRQSHSAGTLRETVMLNGDLVVLGTGRDFLHADPGELEDGSIGLRIVVQYSDDDPPSETWVLEYEAEADFLAVTQGPPDLVGSLFHSNLQYLQADRIVPAVTFPKSHEAVTVKEWLGTAGEHSANYLRVHGRTPAACERARHPESVSSGLLDQVNAWMNQLSPGTGMSVDDLPGTDFVRLAFTRSGPDVRTDPHRATNVGFGLTYALPVILSCLIAQPGSLLLIENPEAHLHPAGQAMLGRLCTMAAASGAQVIVETHSDHVLNAVRLAVRRQDIDAGNVLLHFFSREAGVLQPHVDTLTVGRDGMLPSWPAGFFDQWDQALDELLS